MKVLVASSSESVISAVRRSLAGEKNLRVFAAGDAAAAARGTLAVRPAILMLDAGLLADCAALIARRRERRFTVIGIIPLAGQYGEKVSAFCDLGAADVIGFPFHAAECRMRVQAVRRAHLALMHGRRADERFRIALAHLDECTTRLSTISNSIPAGIVIIDTDTHIIVDANAAALEMFGSNGEQVTGRICHHYICPAERGACPITDRGQHIDHSERVLVNCRGEHVPILKSVVRANLGSKEYLIEMFVDISARKRAEAESAAHIARLQKALQEVKTLSGLLPICASCKRIRDDRGYWDEIELYIQQHSDAQFTHGICPECMKKLYPETG